MKPYYEEPDATLYQGHAIDILKKLSPESVDCVPTSPPYWGLRTYKTEPIDWGDWKGELGVEPTIALYISHLLQIFDEVKRVLKKTGTLWVNIGDSYASGKGTCFNPGGGKGSFSGHGDRKDAGAYPLDRGNISMLKAEGLLPKSLCLIPERFALGMVEHGWILRNAIVWAKANPMPESVKDRFTGSYEYVYFFTKAQRYWFEQQFEGQTGNAHSKGTKLHPPIEDAGIGHESWHKYTPAVVMPYGRNKRDVWQINTQPSPFRGVHFATFPEELVKTPILAGCPSAICKKCGKARERIYQRGEYQKHETETFDLETHGKGANRSKHAPPIDFIDKGYTDCGCNAGFAPGVVMDIFAGTGTTGLVAKKLGRRYIGIELNSKYCKMHVKRLRSVPLAMGLV